jgi:hypothetical protein
VGKYRTDLETGTWQTLTGTAQGDNAKTLPPQQAG